MLREDVENITFNPGRLNVLHKLHKTIKRGTAGILFLFS